MVMARDKAGRPSSLRVRRTSGSVYPLPFTPYSSPSTPYSMSPKMDSVIERATLLMIISGGSRVKSAESRRSSTLA